MSVSVYVLLDNLVKPVVTVEEKEEEVNEEPPFPGRDPYPGPVPVAVPGSPAPKSHRGSQWRKGGGVEGIPRILVQFWPQGRPLPLLSLPLLTSGPSSTVSVLFGGNGLSVCDKTVA